MRYIILFLLIASIVTACTSGDAKISAAVETKPSKSYELGTVEKGSIRSSISLPAQLMPFEIVQLYPKVNGFVKDVPVDRGSVVHTGEVLLKLEAPEIQQQYLAAKSKYLQVYSMYLGSKDTYERLVATSKMPGTVSQHDLVIAHDKMDADSAMAMGEQSNYKSLEATLDYLVMRAPFDGVITERNVHPGALVGPTQRSDEKPLLVLQQESKLRLVIDIPEEYTSQLNKKEAIHFHVNSLPGKIFQGAISRSAGALSSRYRAEAVEADVINNDHSLKPGMYAEVELPIQGNVSAMVVPKSAIVTSTEKKYVVVSDNNIAKWVDVYEGNSQNDSSEVFGTLHPGDKVVLHATDEIKEGTKLQ